MHEFVKNTEPVRYNTSTKTTVENVMFTLPKSARVAVILAAGAILLTACGGSSGITDNPPVNPVVDPNPVQPLNPPVIPPIIPPDDPPPGTDEPDEYVTPTDIAACSIDDINGRVDFDMRDYYIYYDQVPPLDSAQFDTPENFIRALRVDPDIYSFVTDEATQDALSEEGMTTGYGIRFSRASDDVMRFREILLGSPAARAGILRGDELIRLNDRLISEYTNDELRELFGEEPAQITVQIRTANEAARQLVLARETYRWQTASAALYTTEGQPTVGVIQVRSFLETTEQEIDQGITFLLESGIDELIVDLRYNPGGRTRVAERLAAQIVGPSAEGLPFLTRRWNDKYTENDRTSTLLAAQPTLVLPRIIVLMTGRSASASEAFVNGLEPYIDVTVIGGSTEGKIFTSNPRDYCGKTIFAMRSERTNSVGVSVQGGIQPDCSVSDDWTMPASTPADPLTSAALNFAFTGACPDIAIAGPILSNRNRTNGPSFQGVNALLDTPLDLID